MTALVQLGTFLEIAEAINFPFIIVGVREYFIQIIFQKSGGENVQAGLYLWSLEIKIVLVK